MARLGLPACLLILVALAHTPHALEADQTLTSTGPLNFYQVHKASGPIAVDGRLDEFSWAAAEQINAFERILNDYDLVTQPTRAKMLWDDQYFYFAFVCQDKDIWAVFDQEDDPLWSEEVVEVFIDPDGDGKAYLELEVSPTNTVVDLLIHSINPEWKSSKDWDITGLKTAVQVQGSVNDSLSQDLGWTVEIAIPWTAMDTPSGITGGGRPSVGTSWRLNLYRIDRMAGRQTRMQINTLEKQLAPWQAKLDALLMENSVEALTDLPKKARKTAAGLTAKMEPLRAELGLLSQPYRSRTEFTAWSETYQRGFHHPARFGVVQFVE